MLLAVGWLEPVSDDDLFELYCLVLVLDIISDELGLGQPLESGLLLRGRSHVAAFESSAGRIEVFFDQSPAMVMNIISRYSVVRKAHRGLTGTERRPDILVTFKPFDGSPVTNLLIEIKKSADGQYISDSVYKAFGYLHDFASLWKTTTLNPKLILMIPSGVWPKQDEALTEIAMISSDDRQSLAAILTHIFEGR